jgi:hypothetical protein
MPVPTINEIYVQIEEQRSVLIELLNISRTTPISPSRLSDVCMKLAVLNEMLGSFISELKAVQLEAEKQAYLNAKASGVSDTGANNMARLNTIDERQNYEKAFTKHRDLWSLISMAQSHIRAEGDERKGS